MQPRSLLTFRGALKVENTKRGDGSTDLDLYIMDENGNLIPKDESAGDECYVLWKPYWTGTFYVTVLNRNTVWNQYALVTN